jgi:hypothetical protein
MMSPHQVVSANKRRDSESPQGYALRLLAIAYQHVTNGAYDRCLAIIEKHAINTTGEAEDVLSSIQIEIHQEKMMAIDLLKGGLQ